MRKAAPLLVGVLTAAFLFVAPSHVYAADATPTPAAVQAGFTDAQRAEIESIVKDYVTTKHPEVLAEGLQNLQKKEQEDAESKSKSAITEAKDRVFNDAHTPVGGNPKGNVTIVEFYDYQCGYCKMSEEAVEKLLKEDKNIKFIYKDFPILGPVSGEAAKAGLAAVKQGKFQAFHDTLMAKKDHPSSETIYQTAKDVGIDVDRLKKDMEDPAITDEINGNLKLGQEIGVRGTPMFIVNDSVFPGALQYDQLKDAVTAARAAEKK